MNKDVQTSLEAIESSIAVLEKMRADILVKMPLSSRVKRNDWVINKRTNSHSQFVEILHSMVTGDEPEIKLVRHTGTRSLTASQFDADFVLATPEQVENHLRFLNKRGLWYIGMPIEDSCGSLKSIPADTLGEIPARKTVENRVSKILKEWEQQAKSVQIPEFYMITVEGKMGSKVRHDDFQTAATEATRLAKLCNHRAHIMGVCAIVEPVEVQKPITEYQLIKK